MKNYFIDFQNSSDCICACSAECDAPCARKKFATDNIMLAVDLSAYCTTYANIEETAKNILEEHRTAFENLSK